LSRFKFVWFRLSFLLPTRVFLGSWVAVFVLPSPLVSAANEFLGRKRKVEEYKCGDMVHRLSSNLA